MPDGLPFGPMDPDDPEMEEKIKGIVAALDAAEGVKVDRNKMRAEARMLETKHFIEGLSDEQLTYLRALIGGLSIEGKHNYQTAFTHGLLMGAEWARDIKPEADVRFAIMDRAEEGTHHVLPVLRKDDDAGWEQEQPRGREIRYTKGDEPDDAA